jgi:hypothetical protein
VNAIPVADSAVFEDGNLLKEKSELVISKLALNRFNPEF